jgi:hypothetical protein
MMHSLKLRSAVKKTALVRISKYSVRAPVQYRATDADIPAKPSLLLLDAGDDASAHPMCRHAEKTGAEGAR